MKKKIPNDIHCIWVGGTDLSIHSSIAGIESWLKMAPEYNVYVWVDSSHRASMIIRPELKPSAKYSEESRASLTNFSKWNISNELDYLSKGYTPEQYAQLSCMLSEIFTDSLAPLRNLSRKYDDRLHICDIHKDLVSYVPKVLKSLTFDENLRAAYDRELSNRGIFPAAAADILRYAVLLQFGGIYIDIDFELTKPLPHDMEVTENLALIGLIDAQGSVRGNSVAQEYQKQTEVQFKNRCFYACNALIATHEQSAFMNEVCQSIVDAYAILDNKTGNECLKSYYEKYINKSTLDITGPNLIRDILYRFYFIDKIQATPVSAVDRLINALQQHPKIVGQDRHELLFNDDFPRFAKVWRDDDNRYFEFWTWVYTKAYFPMEYINWETEASKQSDTKEAGKQ